MKRLATALTLTALALAPKTFAEDIQIHGKFHLVPVSNYQRMKSNYDAIAQPRSDGLHLHLHVFARLEPGNSTPTNDRLYLDTPSGAISLFHAPSNEVILPQSPTFLPENPDVMAALRPDETIHFKATVEARHLVWN